ncbi:IQ domain-containing protein K [Athene cunicularia]|uniref:IQ domain-containing protein K n=1 Tax=Athene cunicularia TaxID=194338 RepID=UPI000EF65DD7|nr:IQ domain-containing protein K [Athene cunicularia]
MKQSYSADTVVQQSLSIPEAGPFPEPPDPKTCSPQEYLEYYVFPVLLPGMAELLHQAKKEKCFERKRTKFIACDFLTEWLYNKNPKRKDESFTEFFSIPFVKDWLKDHPRPPIPLSLLLSEEAASIVIQSFWRGYRVRCDSEIQELRQWQKQLRENKNIIKRVEEFWTKQEAKVFCLCWLLGKQMLFPGDLPLWNDFSPFLWEANWKTWKNPHEIIQHLNFSFLTNITKYRAHGLNFVVLI